IDNIHTRGVVGSGSEDRLWFQGGDGETPAFQGAHCSHRVVRDTEFPDTVDVRAGLPLEIRQGLLGTHRADGRNRAERDRYTCIIIKYRTVGAVQSIAAPAG